MDADLERRLLAGDSQAAAGWKRIEACSRYFDDKAEWHGYRPYGRLAVVLDPATGGLLSGGILDLLSVLQKAALPAAASRLTAANLQGAQVVLNLDAGALYAQKAKALQAVQRAGGVAVNPSAGWQFPPVLPDQANPDRRQLDRIQPIWERAYDATALKNFGVRTFNTTSVIFNLFAKRASTTPERKHENSPSTR